MVRGILRALSSSSSVVACEVNSEKRMFLIGLTGCAGHGKDTVADYLVDKYGFVKLSYAGPLKDGVAAIFGFDRERMENDRAYKESESVWGRSPRHYLQWLGTDILRKHVSQDFFMLRMRNELDELMASGKNVVVSDARFDNEAAMLLECGARDPEYQSEVWEISAWDRLGNSGTLLGSHVSEAGVSPNLVTRVIENNKRRADLCASIDKNLDGLVQSLK